MSYYDGFFNLNHVKLTRILKRIPYVNELTDQIKKSIRSRKI